MTSMKFTCKKCGQKSAEMYHTVHLYATGWNVDNQILCPICDSYVLSVILSRLRYIEQIKAYLKVYHRGKKSFEIESITT